MNTFRYEAVSDAGTLSRSQEHADDEQQLIELLARRGLTLVRVLRTRATVTRQRRGERMRPRDLAGFARYVSVTSHAGLSVVDSIDDFARRVRRGSLRTLLLSIATDVRGGVSLGEAFSRHPRCFPPAFVGMVRAGEATGTLDQAMQRAASQTEFQLAVRTQIRGALMPMAILLVALVGLVILLITFLLPRLLKAMVGTGVVLPLPTRVLLAISTFLTSHWLLLTGGLLAAFLGVRLVLRSPEMRARIGACMLQVPVVGPLLRMSAEARFASSMSSLIAAGMDAVHALQMAADTCGLQHLRDRLHSASRRIEAGSTLTEALTEVESLNPLLQRMLQLGEKTGALAETLETAVEYYAAEIPRCVKRSMQVLEPAILLGAGALIAFIILATIMPIFSLYDSLQ